ncbi:hypothetical protein [Duganella vulcania]|uniref:hypothetical protein n=1 Tax=Duganella vulcania TaxID=2692166 RepID=UPI0020C36274|nr:hypothetical protein [Duganella vulcania]
MGSNIDPEVALEKLHQLQSEGGDLGAKYWLDISQLLKQAAEFQERTLSAEEKLRQIRQVVADKGASSV